MPIGRSPTRPVEEDIVQRTTAVPEELPGDTQRGNMEEVLPRTSIDAAQTVRLPPFWKDNPTLWFAQVEAAFAIHRITGDESKFRYIVLHADQSVLPFVADLITNPPEQGKYQTLKERICSVWGETSAAKIRKLLGSHELGDEKPSLFLQRIRNLAAGQVTDEILKSIFMEQLPENVRAILAISEVQDLSKLAAQADKVIEMARPTSTAIQAVSRGQADGDSRILQEIAELKRQVRKLTFHDHRRRSWSRGRSASRGRTRQRQKQDGNSSVDYCYYHNRFGDKAFKCSQPCTYNKPKAMEN